MNNLYLSFITCLICYITFLITYQLALAFIGFSLPLKRVLLPILIVSIIGYVSKIGFNASAPVHTVIVLVTCTGILHIFNKISILYSLIGSLLSFITLTLGSILMACPVFINLGYAIPLKFNGLHWILLSLLELLIPTIVLIFFKATKFSLMKYIPN